MRRIAMINQKGGVGKTTTTVNLGAALALAGKRVVLVDLDPQANLTLYLGIELSPGEPSSYRVLTGEIPFASALRQTSTRNLRVLPTDIDLSGAELELSSADRRESLLRSALEKWSEGYAAAHPGEEPADYVLFDCPPSLGLLSLNALTAADEVFLVVQTQFLALQGMSKLVEVIDLVKKKLHPTLELTGIVPCMYDNRMRLAREVLSELRRYFPDQVFRSSISSNVKLAESPSFGQTIFEYAPDSIGARDFALLSHEVLARAARSEPAPAEKKAKGGKRRAPLVPLPPPPAAPPKVEEVELTPAPSRKRQAKPPAATKPKRPDRTTRAGAAPAPAASMSASPAAPAPGTAAAPTSKNATPTPGSSTPIPREARPAQAKPVGRPKKAAPAAPPETLSPTNNGLPRASAPTSHEVATTESGSKTPGS